MLHIIWILLKIIGIFLLILLAAFVFLIIAVLAAPVTYRITGEWNGELNLNGKISWLYRIVGIYICFKDGTPAIRVSLFGRGGGPESDSTKKKKKQGKKKRNSDETVFEPPEIIKIDESPQREVAEESKGLWQETAEEVESLQPETVENNQEMKQKAVEVEDDFLDNMESEEFQEFEEHIPEMDSEENNIVQMIRQGMDFLKRPPVKKLIGRLWRSIRRMFKHLLPSDLHLRARIGTDDPALTGRIMELAAVIYAFYGDRIEIVSDFEEKMLEAEFVVKGWLIPGYLIIKLLGMALRAVLNKECRSLYKEIKQSLS